MKIKKIIPFFIICLFLLTLSVFCFADDTAIEKPVVKDSWTKTTGVGLFYQNHGYLLEYKFEQSLKHNNSIGYGVGFFINQGYTRDIEDQNGGAFATGDLSSTIIPISLSLFHTVREGFFIGKWGIGTSVYHYIAKIDVRHNNGSLYSGEMTSGVGANVFIPFEGLLTFEPSRGKTDWFIKLNIILRFLGTPSSFQAENAGSKIQVDNVRVFDGISGGIFIGKHY